MISVSDNDGLYSNLELEVAGVGSGQWIWQMNIRLARLLGLICPLFSPSGSRRIASLRWTILSWNGAPAQMQFTVFEFS
jgi:hypothetical protein